ncbi:MAG: CerR family C-terminal domain-containing protein [Desulfobacterales bacterium]|nr:CerR family C-terminal domain-containing protein [Desulfobacterales bacterium]
MKGNTKDKILRAAIRVFAQKGYRAATVREIMAEAGAANPSAVTYHFKGKENLYRAVLEFMFEDAAKFIPDKTEGTPSPAERLRQFIHTYMKIIYALDTELDADLAAIFSKELTHPSPFLGEMVEKYLVPGGKELRQLLREIAGPHVSKRTIEKCEDSIMGQIYYPLFAWPLISGARPKEPRAHEQIQESAEHIFKFSLAGLQGFTNADGSPPAPQ